MINCLSTFFKKTVCVNYVVHIYGLYGLIICSSTLVLSLHTNKKIIVLITSSPTFRISVTS